MSYLNENVEFNTVATPDVRQAFLKGAPESKELLKEGSRLYKWTQYPLVGPKGITPWWTLVDSVKLKTGTVVPGLAKLREWAARLEVHEREYTRAGSAITKQWNTMDRPLFVGLKQSVWGWIGKASGQLRDQNEPNVFLIGGRYQVWIPHLTTAHIVEIPPVTDAGAK